MTDSVLNLRNEPRLRGILEHTTIHEDIVLIDRRTDWGNPFRIGADGDRDTVIALYRDDLWHRIRIGNLGLEELAQLAGCRLACWCDPLPCHGHVLARAALWAEEQLAAG